MDYEVGNYDSIWELLHLLYKLGVTSDAMLGSDFEIYEFIDRRAND